MMFTGLLFAWMRGAFYGTGLLFILALCGVPAPSLGIAVVVVLCVALGSCASFACGAAIKKRRDRQSWLRYDAGYSARVRKILDSPCGGGAE